MTRTLRRFPSLCKLLLLALVACSDETLRVQVEQAQGFMPRHGTRVSVFGAFQDGKMSEPAWFAIAPKLAAVLREPACDLGYGNDLRDQNPELAASLEQSIRENGIDDDVLTKVAPGAEGDLVLVLLVYSDAPARQRTAAAVRPTVARRPGRFGRGGYGSPPVVQPERLYELSASLYSTAERKLVAQVDVRYTGDDRNEAIAAFAEKLRAIVPDGRCVGWKW